MGENNLRDQCNCFYITDNTNILAVLRAIEGVKTQIVSIAGTLRIKPPKIDQIKSSHSHDIDRLAIRLMDEWLRGANVMVDKPPYTLHKSDQHKRPSWWDLVWAVHHRNPAHAEKIAKKWNGMIIMIIPIQIFKICFAMNVHFYR